MADTTPFAKLVPGFDFLQDLVKNAGSALPHMGQWVAPTLNPEELEKRIGELRTVQFWLEQNARMLGATIQALEVQRMTLSTLKTMNVQMEDLRESLTIKMPPTPGGSAAANPFGAHPFATAAPASAPPAPSAASPGTSAGTADPQPGERPASGAAVDPMQWWGALTQQFTQLATEAMKESAATASKSMAATQAASSAAGGSKPGDKAASRAKTRDNADPGPNPLPGARKRSSGVAKR